MIEETANLPEQAEGTARDVVEVTSRGLPSELWLSSLHHAARLTPGPVGPLTVVAAHPDDETLGAGGLLHRLAAAGAAVTAVFVTDGAAGYPGSTPSQAAGLARTRRREALAALAALGLADARAVFLDLPDGRVPEVGLMERLIPLLEGAGLCLAPWTQDPHPDHRAVGRAVLVAASAVGVTAWQYPVWMRHSIRPDHPMVGLDQLRVLRLSASERQAKRAAIETHASQLRSPVPGFGPVLPDHVLAYFADGLEPFFVPTPVPPAGRRAL